ELRGGAVAGDGGEAVGERLADAKLLDRGLAVVGAVGPAAVGGQGEGAVGAGGRGLRCEVGLALVDIGDGELAGGGEVAGADRDIPLAGAARNPADHRRAVPARRAADLELRGGAVAGDGGEAVGERLADAELLDRGLAVV